MSFRSQPLIIFSAFVKRQSDYSPVAYRIGTIENQFKIRNAISISPFVAKIKKCPCGLYARALSLLVAPQGFEPRYLEPKSSVLPLDEGAIQRIDGLLHIQLLAFFLGNQTRFSIPQ